MTAKIHGDYEEKHCKTFFNCMSELHFNIETKEKTKKNGRRKVKAHSLTCTSLPG